MLPSFGPLRKQIYQKDPKVDPFRIESGPSSGLFLVPSFCQMCWSFASCYMRKMSSLKLFNTQRVFEWGVNKPPGRHQIQNAEGPVLDPCAKQIYFRRTQKWTLLGSKVVPPGGPVFGPFILSDVLKLCKLLYTQNVKLEATLTQTAPWHES